ncbi:MAG TPA: hypothetical protein ENL45_00595 [Candidatus Woesearchaeota archaeon]|nr:hypothetical protein [Candidatus Woesearchaeota archaeon]
MINSLVDKLNEEDIKILNDARLLVRKRKNTYVWPMGGIDDFAIGSLTYKENEKEVTKEITWKTAYELAEKKNNDMIYDIETSPKDLGKILGAVDRSLGIALSNKHVHGEARVKHAVESISMLYVLGKTNDGEYTTKIKDALKDNKNSLAAEAIGTMLIRYNMMDMYDNIFGKNSENINDKYKTNKGVLTSDVEDCIKRKGQNVVSHIGYFKN